MQWAHVFHDAKFSLLTSGVGKQQSVQFNANLIHPSFNFLDSYIIQPLFIRLLFWTSIRDILYEPGKLNGQPRSLHWAHSIYFVTVKLTWRQWHLFGWWEKCINLILVNIRKIYRDNCLSCNMALNVQYNSLFVYKLLFLYSNILVCAIKAYYLHGLWVSVNQVTRKSSINTYQNLAQISDISGSLGKCISVLVNFREGDNILFTTEHHCLMHVPGSFNVQISS